jgi:alkylated DNA repair dioxygenase AlkB
MKNGLTNQKLSFDLGHGDILIMGGQTQKFWQHKVPKTSKKVDSRINLTFRVLI